MKLYPGGPIIPMRSLIYNVSVKMTGKSSIVMHRSFIGLATVCKKNCNHVKHDSIHDGCLTTGLDSITNFSNRFTCVVESLPVKQEVSC